MGVRLLALLGVALALFLLFTRVVPPPAPWHLENQACHRCHGNQKLPTHTPEFLLREHGEVSLAFPGRCLACHQQAACDRCHLDPDRQPAWHDQAVREPLPNGTAWRRHAQEARQRRHGCATCHAASQQRDCMGCHRAGEVFPEAP